MRFLLLFDILYYMIKKVVQYAWSARYQFVKYFAVGLSGVFLDMATLIFFKEKLLLLPVIAVSINQFIVLVYNFILNKYWSFKNTQIPHKQIVRFGILALWNYLFSIMTMYLFTIIFSYDYRFVRVVTIVVAVSWNFLLYKHWVYRKEGLGPACRQGLQKP